MKKALKPTLILLTILFLSLVYFSGCSVMEAVQKNFKKNVSNRYGSGTTSDLMQNVNNPDKLGTLAPYYTKINKMFDDGWIMESERDRRKNELSAAYDKKGKWLNV